MWWLLPVGVIVGYVAGRASAPGQATALAHEAVAQKRAAGQPLVTAQERAQIERSSDPDAALEALIDRKEAEAKTILRLGPIRITE